MECNCIACRLYRELKWNLYFYVNGQLTQMKFESSDIAEKFASNAGLIKYILLRNTL